MPVNPILKPFLLLMAFGLLLFLTFAIYWPGLHGPFILDDLQSLDPVHMNNFSFRSFLEICLQNDTGPLGRPISIATFALNYLFFGDKPFYFKAVNLGLHLFISVALAVFIYLIVLLQPKAKKHALTISLLTSGMWLIHPLQVSTVLYVVQRMTQLCHLFIIIGLNTYLYGRIRLLTHKKYAYSWMMSSLVIFFPLSVFSKETGMLFIWYLFCTEYFVLGFYAKNKQDKKRLVLSHRFLSLSLLLTALCYYLYQLPTFLTMFAEKNLTLIDRLMTQSKVVIFYLKLILFPSLSQMGLYHDDFPISYSFDKTVFLGSLGIACCFFLIFTLRKRAPIFAFGLAWFFLSHVIESTILPLELVFEHRNYLACIGLLLIPCYYVVLYISRSSLAYKITCSILLLGLMSLLMTLTLERSIAWSSPYKFLAKELYHHPQSTRAHIEMANWYLTKENYTNAFIELQKAQALQPLNAGIELHKMLIFCRAKSIPPSFYDSALEKLSKGAITPYVIIVLNQMVMNMLDQNCNALDKQKITEIIHHAIDNPFIEYKPLYKAVLYHLESGVALLDKDINQSRLLLNKSFEVYPKRLDPLIQKAYLELQHGMIKDAEKTIKKVDSNAHFLRSSSKEIMTLHKALNTVKTGADK